MHLPSPAQYISFAHTHVPFWHVPFGHSASMEHGFCLQNLVAPLIPLHVAGAVHSLSVVQTGTQALTLPMSRQS